MILAALCYELAFGFLAESVEKRGPLYTCASEGRNLPLNLGHWEKAREGRRFFTLARAHILYAWTMTTLPIICGATSSSAVRRRRHHASCRGTHGSELANSPFRYSGTLLWFCKVKTSYLRRYVPLETSVSPFAESVLLDLWHRSQPQLMERRPSLTTA